MNWKLIRRLSEKFFFPIWYAMPKIILFTELGVRVEYFQAILNHYDPARVGFVNGKAVKLDEYWQRSGCVLDPVMLQRS